jgi:IclR family mhp operon transcriptional activator
MRRLVSSTLRRGWAVNEGEWLPQADFAAIALPVRAGRRVVAAINLVFPKSAVSRVELARRYVLPLRELVESIGARLERSRGTHGAHG